MIVIIDTPSNRLALLISGLISHQEVRDESVEVLIESLEQLGPKERERLSAYLFESGTPDQQAAFTARMNPPATQLEPSAAELVS